MLYRIVEYREGIVIPTNAGDVVVGQDGIAELTDEQADELTGDGIMLIPHVERTFGRQRGEKPVGLDALSDAVQQSILDGMERAAAVQEAFEHYSTLPTKADAFRDSATQWR